MKPRALLVAFGFLLAGCGGSEEVTGGFRSPSAPQAVVQRNPDGSINDQSRCDYRARIDREATETAGPGSIQPNVRRVYAVLGQGDDRHKVLVCREIDTNFDGVKDIVRKYNDKGESLHEEADANYDGRVDTWITFAKGRLAEVRVDGNGDGNPDEWKFYTGGKLARVKRDTNIDGKPDVWEIYRDGKLERMGVDVDADERVDRWDHDTDVRRKAEEEDRLKEAKAVEEAEKKAAAAREAAAKADEEAAAAEAATPGKKPPKKPTQKK